MKMYLEQLPLFRKYKKEGAAEMIYVWLYWS